MLRHCPHILCHWCYIYVTIARHICWHIYIINGTYLHIYVSHICCFLVTIYVAKVWYMMLSYQHICAESKIYVWYDIWQLCNIRAYNICCYNVIYDAAASTYTCRIQHICCWYDILYGDTVTYMKLHSSTIYDTKYVIASSSTYTCVLWHIF